MFVHNENRPVRLLHVVGDSRFGGAAHIILGLGHIAKAQGWHVDILATDPVFQQAVRQSGLGLVTLDVIRRSIRPVWDMGGLVRLHKFLRREPYTVVHTHTSKAGFVGRLAARLANVPVIVHTAHGFAFHERSPMSKLYFYSALERVASVCCDRIVSVSEFHRRWALELGMCRAPKILAIPNGVAEPQRNPAVAPAELRRQLGAGEGDLLILTMSRLADDKGLEHLIEAAAILPGSGRRFHFAIAGDGPERGRLEQLAHRLGVADRVKFLGHREDTGDLLAACDLVVLSSLREGMSMALLEAMAAAKPIVATRIGSHVELAGQADMARLVTPADTLALSEAILQVAGDPALMANLGTTARALFESRYTESRMLNQYQQLYHDLLEARFPAASAAAGHQNRFGLTGGSL